MTGPYEGAAWLYRAAGWEGVLPLPERAKSPPPSGFTGWAGVDPSGADVAEWIHGPERAGNIALRLPYGVYGLDVDAYPPKRGGEALAAACARLGGLPSTWIVTSRDDGTSGIRLFRADVPPGRRWKDEPAGHGVGIEAIHFGHRYAVVSPSVHPETGRKYAWFRPTGEPAEPDELPAPGLLPELPAAWIEALSEAGDVSTAEAASHIDTLVAVNSFPTGEPCRMMREAHERALARLREAVDGAALHPAGRDATKELVSLGYEGHAGAKAALSHHFSAFVDVRRSRGDTQAAAEGEWWRMVRGAVGKLEGAQRAECDCALLAGEGVQFDPFEGAEDPKTRVLPTGEVGNPAATFLDGDLVGALRARLLTAPAMRKMPPPSPLVEGLLCLDSESWLIARSGSFKTFVALDVAGHVGASRRWMDRAVNGGPVLFLVAEGIGGMGDRIQAWEQRNGPMGENVHFLPTPIQVKRDDHWSALVELGREIEPALVILDTQARITVGLNENDNSEMGEFVEAIGRLRRATRACVLVVHHLGRSGQDARGASAIDGAQDSELRLTKTAPFRVVLETDKQRHLPDDVRVELELFPATLDNGRTSLVVGPPLSSALTAPEWVALLAVNQMSLAEAMVEIFPAVGATKAELKSEARKRRVRQLDGSFAPPMSESSFRRAWDALVDGGRFIRIEGTQRYVINDHVSGVSE